MRTEHSMQNVTIGPDASVCAMQHIHCGLCVRGCASFRFYGFSIHLNSMFWGLPTNKTFYNGFTLSKETHAMDVNLWLIQRRICCLVLACCINENQLAEPTSDSIIKIEYSNKKNWIVIDKCLATKYLKKERNFVNAGHKILAINYVKWWNSMICNNKHLM